MGLRGAARRMEYHFEGEDKTAGGERLAGKHGEQAKASHLPQVEDQAGA